ncbi:MAG: topoisomerase C-terminal repeat-containing protein [Peptococcaceae bacterium]|jgi:hypothetical protein|nr:topoisomerase C-terminal repeat-containing protein [Peptococcaceae bacterium]
MNCPACGKTIVEAGNSFRCDCAVVPKTMLGKRVTPEILLELLANRRTGVLHGFVSRKNGKEFSSSLIIDEEGKVRFEFDRRQGENGEARIRIISRNSGSAQVTIEGVVRRDFHVDYGHVSSRMAECLALITAVFLIRHILKDIAFVNLDIRLNNLDFSRHILKERVPREMAMRDALDTLFAVLDRFKNWTAQYTPEKRVRLAGSPHSDRFPEGIFPGINVGLKEDGDKLIVTFPPDRPDVQEQFLASIRNSAPKDRVSCSVPLSSKSACLAWLSSVKKDSSI